MRLRLFIVSMTCIGILGSTAPLLTHGADSPGPRVTIDFQNVDISVIINAMAQTLKRTILLDPGIKFLVTWQTAKLTHEDAYKDFARVLTERGLTMREGPDGVIHVGLRPDVSTN